MLRGLVVGSVFQAGHSDLLLESRVWRHSGRLRRVRGPPGACGAFRGLSMVVWGAVVFRKAGGDGEGVGCIESSKFIPIVSRRFASSPAVSPGGQRRLSVCLLAPQGEGLDGGGPGPYPPQTRPRTRRPPPRTGIRGPESPTCPAAVRAGPTHHPAPGCSPLGGDCRFVVVQRFRPQFWKANMSPGLVWWRLAMRPALSALARSLALSSLGGRAFSLTCTFSTVFLAIPKVPGRWPGGTGPVSLAYRTASHRACWVTVGVRCNWWRSWFTPCRLLRLVATLP